jgi:hypothetical protein
VECILELTANMAQKILQNQTVSNILISDYTSDAKLNIPPTYEKKFAEMLACTIEN